MTAAREFSDAAPWHAEFTAEGDGIRSDGSFPICPATGEAGAAVLFEDRWASIPSQNCPFWLAVAGPTFS